MERKPILTATCDSDGRDGPVRRLKLNLLPVQYDYCWYWDDDGSEVEDAWGHTIEQAKERLVRQLGGWNLKARWMTGKLYARRGKGV